MFHYQTQPLPSPIAYYAYHLPIGFHKVCVGGVFFIELIVPFFVFLPRRFQVFACCAFILLQSAIISTGNYTFFNLLTILLCLFLLQDKDIAKILPNKLISVIQQKKSVPGTVAHAFAAVWATMIMLVCASQIWLFHVGMPNSETIKTVLRTTSKFSLINNYGPFAVMTTTRNEITVQGSNDGLNWSDYSFYYKPGALNRELSWNIPHQPRLDWQMWFEALNPSQKSAWFDSFLIKLLEGSPQVLSLLKGNPFPDKPPKYIRALVYQYAYTSQEQRKNNSQIWNRSNPHIYSQAKSLAHSISSIEIP